MSLVLHVDDGTIDKSRFRHDMTPNGDAIVGKNIELDGSGDYIDIDDIISDISSDTTGTLLMYVKPDDITPAAAETFFALGDTDANEIIFVEITTAGLLRAVCIDAGTTQWDIDTDASAFVSGAVRHIAIVQDGTEPVLYVNGEAPAQTFTTSTDKTAWISDCVGIDNGRIGDRNYNSGGEANELAGVIYEAKYYSDEAWTSDQIKYYYLRTRSQY